VAEAVVVEAPAKVNLYLGVGPRRGDGYHDLTTVFQTVELSDRVTIEPAESLEFECDVDLGIADSENLAVRAALAFAAVCGRHPAVRVSLRKQIPAGAGLAGGSSDAAAVIAGLAEMWEMDTSDAHLRTTAAALGSDVPFFLSGGTSLYTGRGDEFAARVPFVPLDIVLVYVGVPVATQEAYSAFDSFPHTPTPGPEALVAACASGDPARVAATLYNNMTDASVGLVAGIAETLAWCQREKGVLGAAMAGSGSAVFAVCASAESAEEVAVHASRRGWWSCATKAIERGVTLGLEEAS